MTGVRLLTVPTTGPDDTDALKVLSENGSSPGDILAVIGKTEGNGCVNDFSRTLAAASWGPRLAALLLELAGGELCEGVIDAPLQHVQRMRPGEMQAKLRARLAGFPGRTSRHPRPQAEERFRLVRRG